MKMIRAMIFIIVIVYGIIRPAYSQMQIGLSGGMNKVNYKASGVKMFDVKQEDFHERSFFNFGIVCDYQLADFIYFHTELQYLQKGTKYQKKDDDSFNFTVSYLELPLFLKASIGGSIKLYVQAGPFIGFYLDGDVSIRNDDISARADIKKAMEDIDFGTGVGAGFSWNTGSVSLFFESSYRYGLMSVFKGGEAYLDLGLISVPYELPPINMKTRGFILKSGIMIPIKLNI